MIKAFRASLLDFVEDPYVKLETSYRYFEDGLLVIEDGIILQCGDYATLKTQLMNNAEITDYRGYLIMPGFIDTHVHYAQTDIIASHGAQLLDWLKRYTFPTEKQFSDESIARDTAQFFIQQLLANGTTSALVFATIHPESVDAIFNAALQQQMRLISGKVMMDRNAPEYLLDTPQSSYDDSITLIQKWHKNERLSYAVTPRFAPTSTEDQLKVAQQLVNEYPDVHLQSHVAENRGECDWVKQLFPWSRSYLDVYDHYGLLGDRSVYAHCIYLDDQDRARMAESGAAVSFCPTSNLFLGSGLFDMQAAVDYSVRLGVGTDVGGGTSFSLIKTLHEAYKVCQLRGYNLSPLRAFYSLTLGGARSLYLDDVIGNFETGKEADFVVLDLAPTDLMKRRMSHAENLDDQLFALIILGDDRNIHATHVLGDCRYQRKTQ
jgi:guanine deaminase